MTVCFPYCKLSKRRFLKYYLSVVLRGVKLLLQNMNFAWRRATFIFADDMFN